MKRPLTAREMLKLSSQERDRVLEAAANLAYEDYVSDPELTGFEAFGDTTRARSMRGHLTKRKKSYAKDLEAKPHRLQSIVSETG